MSNIFLFLLSTKAESQTKPNKTLRQLQMCELTDTLNQDIYNPKRISQSDYESPLGRKMKLSKSLKTIATINAVLQ